MEQVRKFLEFTNVLNDIIFHIDDLNNEIKLKDEQIKNLIELIGQMEQQQKSNLKPIMKREEAQESLIDKLMECIDFGSIVSHCNENIEMRVDEWGTRVEVVAELDEWRVEEKIKEEVESSIRHIWGNDEFEIALFLKEDEEEEESESESEEEL